MLAAGLLSALACLAPPQDVGRALARLSSDSARERAEAERWLAAHLAPADFPALAAAARAGRLEERTRIARALGADERHFELAVLFLSDEDTELAQLGGEALGALATRWFGGDLEPWSNDRVALQIAGRSRGIVSIEPASAPPASVLERLARHAPTFHTDAARDVELGLSVEPALHADLVSGKLISRAESGTVRAGSFELVLTQTLVDLRVSFEGHGFEGEHPFLRIGYGADLGSRSTAQLVGDWCRDVSLYPDRPRGQGAAMALAGCGWPAPLEWLLRRWERLEDRNALAGLLVAAGRGRVAPGLATAPQVERLLREVAAQRARDGSFDAASRRVRHALEHFPRIGRDGTDLAARVAAFELPGADGSAFVARVLAGMGAAPAESLAAARRRLAEPLAAADGPAALERLALLQLVSRTARGDEPPFELALSPELLRIVVRERAEPQLLAWARSAGARPPRSLAEPDFTRQLDERELATAVLWLALEDSTRALAARLVRDWAAARRSEVLLGERLGEHQRLGEPAPVAELLRAALEGTDAATAARLQRIALLAGVADEGVRRAWIAATVAAGTVAPEDWPLVGVLAGEPGGEGLRELLSAWATGAAATEKRLDAPWVKAYERMLRGLASRGEDAVALELRASLRAALRAMPRHPLFRALESGMWPGLPGPPPVSLEALELGP